MDPEQRKQIVDMLNAGRSVDAIREGIGAAQSGGNSPLAQALANKYVGMIGNQAAASGAPKREMDYLQEDLMGLTQLRNQNAASDDAQTLQKMLAADRSKFGPEGSPVGGAGESPYQTNWQGVNIGTNPQAPGLGPMIWDPKQPTGPMAIAYGVPYGVDSPFTDKSGIDVSGLLEGQPRSGVARFTDPAEFEAAIQEMRQFRPSAQKSQELFERQQAEINQRRAERQANPRPKTQYEQDLAQRHNYRTTLAMADNARRHGLSPFMPADLQTQRNQAEFMQQQAQQQMQGAPLNQAIDQAVGQGQGQEQGQEPPRAIQQLPIQAQTNPYASAQPRMDMYAGLPANAIAANIAAESRRQQNASQMTQPMVAAAALQAVTPQYGGGMSFLGNKPVAAGETSSAPSVQTAVNMVASGGNASGAADILKTQGVTPADIAQQFAEEAQASMSDYMVPGRSGEKQKRLQALAALYEALGGVGKLTVPQQEASAPRSAIQSVLDAVEQSRSLPMGGTGYTPY